MHSWHTARRNWTYLHEDRDGNLCLVRVTKHEHTGRNTVHVIPLDEANSEDYVSSQGDGNHASNLTQGD